jgi:predicted DCC family thiol-disulfide oxidoreductase YuxK
MTDEQSTSDSQSPGKTLVLYDGVCALCNWLVRFLIRRDRHDQFRFAPLQGDFAQDLLRSHGLHSQDLSTVVVLANFGQPSERPVNRFQAALYATERLGGIWKLASILRILPLPLREAGYKLIAGSRYRIFGRYDVCPMPRAADRHKFLGGS